LALGGLSVLLTGQGRARAPLQSAWQDPVWLLDLRTGHIQGPQLDAHVSALQIPYGLPGSIMKLIAAMALLEEDLIQSEQQFECRGSIHVHGRWFVCQHAHGKLTIQEALGHSCNVFFAQAVQPLSARRFLRYARRFGLHQPVHGGESFQFEISAAGQEPIQMLALGLSPQIQPNALQLLRLAQKIAQRSVSGFSEATWAVVQGGMRLAARQGTARNLDPSDAFRLAAKTGTAPHGHHFNAWLIGYFPLENPRFAFCVRAVSGTAKDSAVPLARQFLTRKALL